MKALLIVDVQKGFINQYNEGIVENINKILKKFDKVIATKFVNNQFSQYSKLLNWNEMSQPAETEFATQLPKGAYIIQKSTYGLPNHLFEIGGLRVEKDFIVPKGSEIYLCGTDYDACVLAIAYQLFDNGFVPKIISNCMGSSSQNPIDKSIVEKIMKRNFGKNSIIENEKEI